MKAVIVSKESDGLRVVAYPGDNKILLAISLPDGMVDQGSRNLAGFSISRKYPGKPDQVLANRIGFDVGVSNQTTAATHKWTPSDRAPFQKFRWIDVPPDGFKSAISYRVKALYFAGNALTLKEGPQVSLDVPPVMQRHKRFKPAFTRGYIASQAYADKFRNQDIRPKGPKTPDFNTKPFEAQYLWLGADARQQLFDFIEDCRADRKAHVNVFAYDLDEPDVVAAICKFGEEGRLRAILDNAPLHTKPDKSGAFPPEVAAAKMIAAAAGADNVRQGHFDRFQHNKVFIKRDANGQAERVIFGSMNFSVRGLYVQANNVVVVDDPGVAGMFAKAFDVAFTDDVKAPLFRQNPVSQDYMAGSDTDTDDLPKFSLALSPHTNWSVSLGPMAARIRAATSSVLFAVMEPTGQGPVLSSLREIAARPTVFSYGTVETDHGLAVQSPDGAMGEVTSFAVLAKNVPAPFTPEFSGGPGIHIHDKFVVVDFNGTNPTVFTGSSNLAAGGEQENGDSLAMIEDEAIATMYAIEAIALFDHYHFRRVMQTAMPNAPFTLWYPGKAGAADPWWKPYFDKTRIQFRDRCLFAQVALPEGLPATKKVDWTALDAAAASQAPAGKKAAPAGKARKAPTRKVAPRRAAAKKHTSPKRPVKSTATKRAAKKRR